LGLRDAGWVTGFVKGFIVFIYPLLFFGFVVVTQDIDWNGEVPLEGSNPDMVNR
jgi:hypothetical protein